MSNPKPEIQNPQSEIRNPKSPAPVDFNATTVLTAPPESLMSCEEVETLWAASLPGDATSIMTLHPRHEVVRQPTEMATSVNLRKQTILDATETQRPSPAYELRTLLGEGGMGLVYEARQASLDRIVALKMICPERAEDDARCTQFISEAIVMGELDHPNILPIHDIGLSEQGRLFYAMKRVSGSAWDKVIKWKSTDQNLDILLKVCDAVAFAHSRDIIHRDIKPDNVMLGGFGEVLLTDWGIAASVSAKGKAARMPCKRALYGTPAYMAPEMARAQMSKIGKTSDIYLLGAVLYEIVVLRPPHWNLDVRQCLTDAANNKIGAAGKRSELLHIALSAMATNPEQRYPTVVAFQNALLEYRRHKESMNLCATANYITEEAVRQGSYELFAEAMACFKQALKQWPESEHVRKTMNQALKKYAQHALSLNDVELAHSLLDASDPNHTHMLKKIHKARTKRER